MSERGKDRSSARQSEKTQTPSRNILLRAGAGSGKTRAIVQAVIRNLEAGIAPESIVAFSFTNKAADELSSRVAALAADKLPGLSLDGLFVGTIHAWCAQYLRRDPKFQLYTVLDELNTEALIIRLYDLLHLDRVYLAPFHKSVGRFASDLEIYYNENLSLEDVPDSVRATISKFTEITSTNKMLPYGEVIRTALGCIKSRSIPVGVEVLYVDEYQDVNSAQVQLVRAISEQGVRVTVVGDELQCIYNWRGSEPEKLAAFPEEFGECSTTLLSTNYRSRPQIVAIANSIAQTQFGGSTEHVMRPDRGDDSCLDTAWISTGNDVQEATAISDIVSRLHSSGTSWKDMAVLLRSVTHQSPVVVAQLRTCGIPVYCPLLSGPDGFIDGYLVPVLTWLGVPTTEPRSADEDAERSLAARRTWNSVSRWTPIDREDLFWQEIANWKRLVIADDVRSLNIRHSLYALMSATRVSVDRGSADLAQEIAIGSQIIRSVEEVCRQRLQGVKHRRALDVVADVVDALGRYQTRFGETMSLDLTGDAVVVTTIHQAKGLEWSAVIVPGLTKGLFPVRHRPHGTSFPDSIAGRYETRTEDERRLFYVACTRARERLFLLDSTLSRPERSSPFTADLGEHMALHPITSISALPASLWTIDQAQQVNRDQEYLKTGLSDLLLFVECPFEYGLRRVAGVQPAIGNELGYGQGLHALISAKSLAGEEWSLAETRRRAMQCVSVPYLTAEEESRMRERAVDSVMVLQELGVFRGSAAEEIVVNARLPHGLVTGIADNVCTNEAGVTVLRDWKSSVHTRYLGRYFLQLQFYAHALRQRGVNIARAEIVDVRASTESQRLAVTAVDTSPEALSHTVELLDGALKEISLKHFEARPSENACMMCDVATICGRRLNSGNRQGQEPDLAAETNERRQ